MSTGNFGQVNLININDSIGSGINQLDSQISQALGDLASNPNPSPAQLVQLQYQVQLWSNLIQMESSINKVFGDTEKQVVTNMGS